MTADRRINISNAADPRCGQDVGQDVAAGAYEECHIRVSYRLNPPTKEKGGMNRRDSKECKVISNNAYLFL